MAAIQESNLFLIPEKSNIHITISDFKFDFEASFKLEDKGYLNPIVKSCHINLGNSYIYHENPIIAFIMHQVLYYLKVVIENTAYFVAM